MEIFHSLFVFGLFFLFSSKNPEEAELEDTLNQVVSGTLHEHTHYE